MRSFRLSLVKFILGIFLFGLALWVNPIEVSAYQTFGATSYIPNGTTLPYQYLGFFPSDLGTLTPDHYNYVGTYYMPFDLNVPTDVNGNYVFDYSFSFLFFNSFFNVDCNGTLLFDYSLTYATPTGNVTIFIDSRYHEFTFSNDTPYPSFHDTISVHCPGKPLNFTVTIYPGAKGLGYNPLVFTKSPTYSGSALPDSSGSTNTFTLTGYTDPLGSSRILLVGQGGQGTYDGNFTNRGSNITLTGSVPFNNPDYDISFSEDDIDPSGSRFYFGLSSVISNFHDDFEKTIADNTTSIKDQFEEFFDYEPPNTQSFNSDKSTVDSSINSVSTFQSSAFSGLGSAVNDTGLDNFDFAEYGPQMSYVGLLLTSIYNVFPNKFKYVIYFVLFIGFFGVLLNAGHYIKKMRDSE